MSDTKYDIANLGMEGVEMMQGLFDAIHREAKEFSHIKRLAKAGSYLSQDYHNLLDVMREDAKKEGDV